MSNWKCEPYTFERKRVRFWNSFFVVKFEDTTIRIIDNRSDADELVQLLNAAWNLGYMQAAGQIAA